MFSKILKCARKIIDPVKSCISKGIYLCLLKSGAIVIRTVGFLIFFAGDSDRSKEKLRKVLDKECIHRFFIYSFILIFVGLLIVVTIVSFVNNNIIGSPTTFNVTAVTEEVQVVTSAKAPMSRWPVKDIELSRTCSTEEKIPFLPFSGYIDINPSVQITFTRISHGALTVTMHTDEKGKTVGDLFDENDELDDDPLTHCAIFRIKNTENTDKVKRFTAGETIVLPITGEISAGNELRFLTQYKTPVLREGQVTILDRSFIVGENYSVGPFDLKTGDTFEIQNPAVPSQGFILVNEEPAIKLVFRAKGIKGIIKRYQAEDYVLRNSYWSKLYNDEALSLAWVFILVLFTIIRVYLRYLVN